MSEMQEEGRQTGARIEGQIVSLREDIAEEAKILLSIREDNEEALKRHCERELHLEEAGRQRTSAESWTEAVITSLDGLSSPR